MHGDDHIIISSFKFVFAQFTSSLLYDRSSIYNYYICNEIYHQRNMTSKYYLLKITGNLTGGTIFLTIKNYGITNHRPQTKNFH